MKKHFTKYLIEDLGFKSFRKIYKEGKFEYIKNNINDFSTLQNGGLDVRYIKDDIEIIWGLHEKDKPPTLINPRPKILVETNTDGRINRMNELRDDAMNICLKEEFPEDIYKALFDKTLEFKYEK